MAKPKFKVGDRVRYTGDWNVMQGVVGTIGRIYEGYWHTDEETDERYWTGHQYSVAVEKIPEQWPYSGTDKFAPAEEELAKVAKRKAKG